MRDLVKTQAQMYFQKLFGQKAKEPSGLFEKARNYSQQVGKEAISLSVEEARLVAFLVKSHGCKKFIEIGTLTGYSALWTLEGMGEGGTLWTFEKDKEHAALAEKIFAELPQGRVHLMVGDAREELEKISSQGPFDGIFIDGNKAAYGDYLEWAEKNVRKGGLILADNVYLGGSVWGEVEDSPFSAKQVKVMQAFNERLADPEKYFGMLINTSEGLFAAIKLF